MNSWTKNDLGIFLRDTRSFLELEEKQSLYPTLNFYCNWAAHPRINRNKHLYTFLETISVGFAELIIPGSDSNKKYKDYVYVVIDALNFKGLENELKEFFKSYFNQKQRPKEFFILLLENVLHKVIEYPNSGKNKHIEKTKKRSEKFLSI